MTAKEYLSQALNIDRSINSKLEQVASLHELATKDVRYAGKSQQEHSQNGGCHCEDGGTGR